VCVSERERERKREKERERRERKKRKKILSLVSSGCRGVKSLIVLTRYV